MSSSANPQHEPTMEEILASIRKIISEDQTDGAKPAEESIPVRAAAAAQAQPHVESDVLELTEEVHEEEEVIEAPAGEAQPPIDDDIAFENNIAEPKAAPVMDTDEKFSYTFTKPGTYPYYCGIHPKMTAKVIVE